MWFRARRPARPASTAGFLASVCGAVAIAAVAVSACSSGGVGSVPRPDAAQKRSAHTQPVPTQLARKRPAATSSTATSSTASATPTTAAATVQCHGTVHLAFGGDVNTANAAGRVLDVGMGSVGGVLTKADVAMVNIETVLADDHTGLVPQPKKYNFVAPTRLLDVVGRAGVDVVTVANNHGLDYGQLGLERTLAARSPSRPVVIGAGIDAGAAFSPYRTVVRGRRVVIFAATDVIDDGLAWAATDDTPGLASIKSSAGYERLRTAIRQDRSAHPCDVIAVYLHAGVELSVCPTDRQRQVAADLSADGASAVVMSHAHVVEPGRVAGRTAVDYGLGNLVFAAQSSGTTNSGVLAVDVPPTGAPREHWHPAHIFDGIPTLLTGLAAQGAESQWLDLARTC